MVSRQLVARLSSARDNYSTMKEISKTLENPVFSRVFLMLFSGFSAAEIR